MRIQHNIPAMSAYRNYNNNTSALSKNLEKLSSGYKINRAGDDAAGLAISEKMRAQITGLNAAQKNVKDGVSLVKTAEGAMQEIQDMLNRMDYLATQSANGTYDNEVDRANLQKEVTALKTEIDRIAESANFNGIKLLDGSKDADGAAAAAESANAQAAAAQTALDDAKAALEAAKKASPSLDADTLKSKYTTSWDSTAISNAILADPSTAPGGPTDVGSTTIYETDNDAGARPNFKISFDGVSHVMATGGMTQAGATNAMTLTVTDGTNSATVTLTENDIYKYLNSTGATVADDALKGVEITGKQLAEAFVYKIQDTTSGTSIGGSAAASAATGASGAGLFSDGVNLWSVKTTGTNGNTAGDTIEFTFDAAANQALTAPVNKHFNVLVTGTQQQDVAGTQYTYTSGAVSFTTTGTNTQAVGTVAVTYNDADGAEQTMAVTFSYNAGTATSATMATAIIGALNANATFRGLFSASGDADGIVITTRTPGDDQGDDAVKAKVTDIAFSVSTGDGTVSAALNTGAATVAGTDAYKSGTVGYANAGSEVVLMGAPAQNNQLASTTLKLDQTDITDGMQITLGNETYTFAVGPDSIVTTKDADGNKIAGVIDLTQYTVDDLKAGGDADKRAEAFTKLSEEAKNNDVFTVSHSGTTGYIGLKQLQSAKDDTNMNDREHLITYIGVSTVDQAKAAVEAEAAKKENVANLEKAVADAEKALEDAKAAADKAAEKTGKPLKLQIGDTSESFNQMEVTIGDMHVAAMGTMKRNDDGTLSTAVDGAENSIANVDISTQEGAAKAVDVIKNAINYVSSIRGDLGAIQNRLEHTQNNLSVMAENIQDAESTIRDTDVAEEMMSYVKNNILVQSAQAMLAQANQLPQGVLQLLG